MEHRMTAIKWIIVFSNLLVVGCVNKPTVHIYAKYLSEEKISKLSRQLKTEKLDIEVNKFDFPTSITQNTIIYSLLLDDPNLISHAEDSAYKAGMPITKQQSLTEGNHWYTKNSLAMFLLPDTSSGAAVFFRQDLFHEFVGEHCAEGISLTLEENGTYLFAGKSSPALGNKPLLGAWKFRQYPYLELKRQGSKYATYYFEISQYTKRDRVSDISIIKLSPVNKNLFPKNCEFLYGLRQ